MLSADDPRSSTLPMGVLSIYFVSIRPRDISTVTGRLRSYNVLICDRVYYTVHKKTFARTRIELYVVCKRYKPVHT